MKINGKALGLAFALTLGFWAIALALTTNEIWNAVFVSASNTIRVISVP